MSGTEKDVERARDAARQARARLAGTMSEIQDRLNPRNLINDAWQEVRERGQDLAEETIQIARARPLTAAAIAAGVIAAVAREPIWRAVTTLFAKRRETSPGDEGLIAEVAPLAPSTDEAVPRYREIA